MHRDYDEVAALEEAEQMQLLEKGEPPERLWAAWAIASRSGVDVPLVVRQLDSAHAPDGLRQQLIVVIAGLGQRAPLRALAECDPSVYVRATATAYYVRTARPEQLDEVGQYAASLLSGILSEQVTLALLGEHEAGRISLPDTVLAALLEAGDVEIRRATVKVLCPDDGALPDAVIRALRNEPDLDLRQYIVGKLSRTQVPYVLDVVAGSSLALSIAVLLARRFEELDWTEAAPLIRTGDLNPSSNLMQVDALLGSLRLPIPNEGIAWLCACHTVANGTRVAGTIRWRAGRALRRSLTAANVGLMSPVAATTLMNEIERDLTYWQNVGPDCFDDDEDFDYQEELCELERLAGLLRGART